MNQKAEMACTFNCRIETERVLNVTDSHVHCKSGNNAGNGAK